jgi:type II secretory pathway pseudopilin PulG
MNYMRSRCRVPEGGAGPRSWVCNCFTLVELLVVIATIAVLMSLLVPALQRARLEAVSAVCLSNHRQIGRGIMAYAADHNARYPDRGGDSGSALTYIVFKWGDPNDGWDNSAGIAEYIAPGPVYLCPVKQDRSWDEYWPKSDGSYWWPDYAFWGHLDSTIYEYYDADGNVYAAADWDKVMPARVVGDLHDVPLMTCRTTWFPNGVAASGGAPFVTTAHIRGWQYTANVGDILDEQEMNVLWQDGSASPNRRGAQRVVRQVNTGSSQYWVER